MTEVHSRVIVLDPDSNFHGFWQTQRNVLRAQLGEILVSTRMPAHGTIQPPFPCDAVRARDIAGRCNAAVARKEFSPVSGQLGAPEIFGEYVAYPVNGEAQKTAEHLCAEFASLGLKRGRPIRLHLSIARIRNSENRALALGLLTEAAFPRVVRFEKIIIYHRFGEECSSDHEIELAHNTLAA